MLCCSRSMHSAHCGAPVHAAHGCHPSGHAHHCAGHGPTVHVAHHGCCSPTQKDTLAWLERRLEGLRREAKAVEERIAALQQEQADAG